MKESTQWILAIFLMASGLLTAVFGVYKFGFGLTNLDSLTFLLGGVLLVAIAIYIPVSLPVMIKLIAICLGALATIFYIHQLPGMDLVVKLMSDLPILALAAWLSSKLF